MIGFRKRVLFRVEESFPDPEEQKWRFRRRILLGTFVVVMFILGVPVVQDRIPHLRTLRQARSLAAIILETRLYAAQHRTSISLRLDSKDRHTWVRTFHQNGGCNHPDTTPPERLSLLTSVWRIQTLAESEKQGASNEIQSLCFDPEKGLIADGIVTENNKVVLQGFPEEDVGSERIDRVAQLVLTGAGSVVSILRN